MSGLREGSGNALPLIKPFKPIREANSFVHTGKTVRHRTKRVRRHSDEKNLPKTARGAHGLFASDSILRYQFPAFINLRILRLIKSRFKMLRWLM